MGNSQFRHGEVHALYGTGFVSDFGSTIKFDCNIAHMTQVFRLDVEHEYRFVSFGSDRIGVIPGHTQFIAIDSVKHVSIIGTYNLHTSDVEEVSREVDDHRDSTCAEVSGGVDRHVEVAE